MAVREAFGHALSRKVEYWVTSWVARSKDKAKGKTFRHWQGDIKGSIADMCWGARLDIDLDKDSAVQVGQ